MLGETLLFDSMTPHKLFRRSFVEEHHLRFPEGRRRLEDLVFVVGAYFAAATISVLSDYVCYYHIRREDHSNAGLRRIEPAGYYANLREVIGIIEDHTEAGPLRDRLLERFARIELAGRFNERTFLAHAADYRASIYAEILSVVEDHIPPTVDAILAPLHRVQMALLRRHRMDLLTELAEANTTVSAQARLTGLRRPRRPAFEVDFQAALRLGSTPFTPERRGDRFLLPVPPRVAEAVPDETRALPGGVEPLARLVLRKRDDWAEVVAPTTVVPTDTGVPAVDARSMIDPRTVAVGSPIWLGTWDLLVRVEAYGYTQDARLGSVRAPGIPSSIRSITSPGRPLLRSRVYWTDPGDNLAIRVTDTSRRPAYRRALTDFRERLRRPPAKS